LEAAKAHLSEEAKLLPVVHEEVESLNKEKEEMELATSKLQKQLDEAAKELAAQRALKATEVSDQLREELKAEHESAASLRTRLRDAEVQASALVGLYAMPLANLAVVPPLLRNVVILLLSWLG
jgi:DNA repair ATPase RecN